MHELFGSIRDLVKIYRTERVDVIALRGVNLDLRRREILAISGPSGCGKTTLINICGGVEPPTAGSVLIGGRDVTRLTGRELVDYRRRSVGIVYQFFNLLPQLTALQNVELPMRLLGKTPAYCSQRARQLLTDLGLGDRLNHRPGELSGGQQQRVAIAAALANDPPLILADEPTGELDSAAGREVLELFSELRDRYGKTVVIASHDPNVVRIADRVAQMRDGKIVRMKKQRTSASRESVKTTRCVCGRGQEDRGRVPVKQHGR